jgi:hypothetical protein
MFVLSAFGKLPPEAPRLALRLGLCVVWIIKEYDDCPELTPLRQAMPSASR